MARHGPPVHYRADPGRSRLQLLPLPGIWPATVAVSVSMQPLHSHSRVSRDSYCILFHSNPQREMRPHAPAWQPTSPVCTATAHMLFSHTQHTVAHSPVPHTHTPHPRGHSPAVFQPPRGVRTHVPRPARTWFLPTAVPLLHTAWWEARTPARSRPHHSHTGSHSQPGSHPYLGPHLHTGTHPYTGFHSHSRLLAHNASHPCYACVAARI